MLLVVTVFVVSFRLDVFQDRGPDGRRSTSAAAAMTCIFEEGSWLGAGWFTPVPNEAINIGVEIFSGIGPVVRACT